MSSLYEISGSTKPACGHFCVFRLFWSLRVDGSNDKCYNAHDFSFLALFVCVTICRCSHCFGSRTCVQTAFVLTTVGGAVTSLGC